MDYRTIPALASYIDRIGAEQLNFRKFMVREYRGNYYSEKAYIEIKPDHTITCSNPEHAPTETEATAITAALQQVQFPQYVAAAPAQLRSLKIMLAEQQQCSVADLVIFEFYRRSEDVVIMVQQRRQHRDGRKQYVPWTFWSDGIWRPMEPDEKLPLWKPRHSRNKAKIMIHEGAKAASHVDALLHDRLLADERAKHPWAEELASFEHWGMIGGALAPQRTDWQSVRNEKPLDVVYICDNDFPGKSALKWVSFHLRYALKGIMFDERWQGSFDLADKMPEQLFTADGRWLGPTLTSLMRPATWATEKISKSLTIRREFAEEWLHSVRPEVFVHRHWPSHIMTAQEFNTYMRPFSDTDDLARVLKTDAANKTAVLKYSPELPSGIYTTSDQRFINTHKPGDIRLETGDPGPWNEFMEHLVPDDSDRIELLRWCATLIARPAIKMLYGVLLISETQGVGKGTLGEKILTPLLGEQNVSFPSEAEIVDSNYNYWASHKRLAVVHEIYAGHSAKAYNKLKSIITDHHITVSQKYMANYFIENWVHVFACSNSIRALKLSMDDRRWFVPKITDNVRTTRYWLDLNNWLTLEGGLGIIKQWAHTWLQTNSPVLRGASAPWSTMKKEVVEESYSPGQQWVVQFLDQCRQRLNGHPIVMTDMDLREGIKTFIHEGRTSEFLEQGLTIRKVAKAHGWHIGKDYVRLKSFGSQFGRTKIIASTPELAAATSATELAATPLLDVVAKAREWQRL